MNKKYLSIVGINIKYFIIIFVKKWLLNFLFKLK